MNFHSLTPSRFRTFTPFALPHFGVLAFPRSAFASVTGTPRSRIRTPSASEWAVLSVPRLQRSGVGHRNTPNPERESQTRRGGRRAAFMGTRSASDGRQAMISTATVRERCWLSLGWPATDPPQPQTRIVIGYPTGASLIGGPQLFVHHSRVPTPLPSGRGTDVTDTIGSCTDKAPRETHSRTLRYGRIPSLCPA